MNDGLSFETVQEPAVPEQNRLFVIIAIGLVGLLVLGAILPPNDPFTQLLMAIPLYLLYEASIIAARIMWRGRRETAVRG